MPEKKSLDIPFLLIVVALVVLGVMMVFSSSFYYSITKWNDMYHFFRKSITWAALGMVVMMIFSFINYKVYRKFAPLILFVSFGMLVLVLTGFGVNLNNATRWLSIGGVSIQPSEIAKLSMIIFMAHSLANKKNQIRTFTSGVLPYLIISGVFFLLIVAQPNLSAAIIVVLIPFAMMYVAGVKLFQFVIMGVVGGAVFLQLALTSEYRMKRITTFLNPFEDVYGAGWQVVQSLYALGSGGIFGVGIGQSTQNKLYLPEPQNDFIFATIGEELGFIGAVVVILMFLFLIYRGLKIAVNAPDEFSCYLVTGIIAMISIQTLMNIAVATSSMPVTGVALPFISYGGSSLLILMASMGIVLNVSKYRINR